VGWAFDIWSGQSQAAPVWIQRIGMEWFYRLVENPRKLWKRHLKNNPRYVVFVLLQLLGIRRYPDPMVRGARR
jgi:N-acetylglucosaminyldiphosphoundecaprenol N-acetyl-beta-D-mannosaminyltransferase